MIIFCPYCGICLYVVLWEGKVLFECAVCPYWSPVTKTIRTKFYCKLKGIDDVLGGDEAWKNVDSTEERCPECGHTQAYFMQLQTRSADEPMTTFYRCCKQECSYYWRV